MTNPQRLVDELVRAGWTVVGHGPHHKRLVWPGHLHRSSLMVPLDMTAPEFDDLWKAAIVQLEQAVDIGVRAAHVLAGLISVSPGKGDQQL